jgi:DNA-binding response OmpR family regulator
MERLIEKAVSKDWVPADGCHINIKRNEFAINGKVFSRKELKLKPVHFEYLDLLIANPSQVITSQFIRDYFRKCEPNREAYTNGNIRGRISELRNAFKENFPLPFAENPIPFIKASAGWTFSNHMKRLLRLV